MDISKLEMARNGKNYYLWICVVISRPVALDLHIDGAQQRLLPHEIDGVVGADLAHPVSAAGQGGGPGVGVEHLGRK